MTRTGPLHRLARAPLTVKLVSLVAGLTVLVVAAVFWALSFQIQSKTRDFFASELERSQRTLVNLQRRSLQQGLWTAAILTESPTLNAAISTYRVESAVERPARRELLATIQREVERIGRGVDRELLVVTDEAGRVLAAVGRGGIAPEARQDLSDVPGVRRALDPTSETTEANLSVLPLAGVYFQVTCVPIVLRDFPIGALLLGDRLDAGFATTLRRSFEGEVAVALGERVVSSTLPALATLPESLVRQFEQSSDSAHARVVHVDGERFVATRLMLGLDPLGQAAALYLLHPLSAAVAPLNRSLLLQLSLYAGVALVLVSAAAALASRSTLGGLRRFVGFMDVVAETGDFTRRFDAASATAEIATLNHAYDRLIDSLAEQHRQTRQRTAELSASNEALLQEAAERRRTEQALQQSEEQLRQSQKMEALGNLAGGIAHDFNNLLAVISGYAELVMADEHLQPAARTDLKQVTEASRRAAALTRQLLAFSRKQVLEPKVVDLNDVVDGMEQMLRRLIGEDIQLEAITASHLARVRVDPSQMEQVVLNLVVNARDAMPRGGRVSITTANVELPADDPRRGDLIAPGRWVRLTVRDTGNGMDEATQARIFEPFFTTKEPGKGTGLGLSTVYGIVKQSGGFIFVTSQPGRGTGFDIFLPAIEVLAESELDQLPEPPGGTETILVVEDEARVREITRKYLELRGYRVMVAAGAREAITLASQYDGPIHLLVTDVIMPEMGGREVADRLTARRPALRVLFMSGYPDATIVDRGVLRPGTELLQKPFTQEALARRVRQILDGQEPAARESRRRV